MAVTTSAPAAIGVAAAALGIVLSVLSIAVVRSGAAPLAARGSPATVPLASSSAEVVESSSRFSCCRGLAVAFSREHEHVWSVHGKPFATSSGSSTQCASPCQQIQAGMMTLDSCIDFDVTVIYINRDMVRERKTHYTSLPCSGTDSGSGSLAGQLVLTLLPLAIHVSCSSE